MISILFVFSIGSTILSMHMYSTERSFENIDYFKFIQNYFPKTTEGEQTLWWMFDDELWTRFLNVTFIQLCIYFFSTVKVSNMLVNIVILQWHGISKRYLPNIWKGLCSPPHELSQNRYICLFAIIHQQQRTRFFTTLFGLLEFNVSLSQ